jgi:hypothetical protein
VGLDFLAVGAVYDRALFLKQAFSSFMEKRAVIDHAYSQSRTAD